jgi:predicted nucleic acid-binding protein
MPANIVIDTSAILAVLLDEPAKQAVIEGTMGSVVCAPASLRWEVGNAATAGVKRRRLTRERARQLIIDFEQVTIRELAIDIGRAVDFGMELGIYAVALRQCHRAGGQGCDVQGAAPAGTRGRTGTWRTCAAQGPCGSRAAWQKPRGLSLDE